MASILTKIQRKVLQENFKPSFHCLKELKDERFDLEDAISAILNAKEFDRMRAVSVTSFTAMREMAEQ